MTRMLAFTSGPADWQALLADPPQRQNFAPVQAILAARHEAQYSRLFRS